MLQWMSWITGSISPCYAPVAGKKEGGERRRSRQEFRLRLGRQFRRLHRVHFRQPGAAGVEFDRAAPLGLGDRRRALKRDGFRSKWPPAVLPENAGERAWLCFLRPALFEAAPSKSAVTTNCSAVPTAVVFSEQLSEFASNFASVGAAETPRLAKSAVFAAVTSKSGRRLRSIRLKIHPALEEGARPHPSDHPIGRMRVGIMARGVLSPRAHGVLKPRPDPRLRGGSQAQWNRAPGELASA